MLAPDGATPCAIGLLAADFYHVPFGTPGRPNGQENCYHRRKSQQKPTKNNDILKMISRAFTTCAGGLLALGSCFAAAQTLPQGVRVYFNESCIAADEPVISTELDVSKVAGLAGTVVSHAGQAFLADLIRGIAKVIRASTGGRETIHSVDQDMYLYAVDYPRSPELDLTPALGCLTVVGARFQPDTVSCVEQYEPAYLEGDRADEDAVAKIRGSRSIENVLRRANVCVDGRVNFVFENRIERSDDGTAFRLKGAGHEFNSPLSARRSSDRRALLLTVSIFEPSADGRGGHLATSWINYGEISAGARILEREDDRLSAWTKTPELSAVAAQSYQRDNHLYRETIGAIEELERAVLRGARQLGALEEQLETADPQLRAGLVGEIDRLNLQVASDTAARDAWLAQYDDLPAGEHRYMPVTVRVAVTEAKTEKQLAAWLADLLEAYSDEIATDLAIRASGGF